MFTHLQQFDDEFTWPNRLAWEVGGGETQSEGAQEEAIEDAEFQTEGDEDAGEIVKTDFARFETWERELRGTSGATPSNNNPFRDFPEASREKVADFLKQARTKIQENRSDSMEQMQEHLATKTSGLAKEVLAALDAVYGAQEPVEIDLPQEEAAEAATKDKFKDWTEELLDPKTLVSDDNPFQSFSQADQEKAGAILASELRGDAEHHNLVVEDLKDILREKKSGLAKQMLTALYSAYGIDEHDAGRDASKEALGKAEALIGDVENADMDQFLDIIDSLNGQLANMEGLDPTLLLEALGPKLGVPASYEYRMGPIEFDVTKKGLEGRITFDHQTNKIIFEIDDIAAADRADEAMDEGDELAIPADEVEDDAADELDPMDEDEGDGYTGDVFTDYPDEPLPAPEPSPAADAPADRAGGIDAPDTEDDDTSLEDTVGDAAADAIADATDSPIDAASSAAASAVSDAASESTETATGYRKLPQNQVDNHFLKDIAAANGMTEEALIKFNEENSPKFKVGRSKLKSGEMSDRYCMKGDTVLVPVANVEGDAASEGGEDAGEASEGEAGLSPEEREDAAMAEAEAAEGDAPETTTEDVDTSLEGAKLETGDKDLAYRMDLATHMRSEFPGLTISPEDIQIFTADEVDGKPRKARVVMTAKLNGKTIKMEGVADPSNIDDPVKDAVNAVLRKLQRKLQQQERGERQEARETAREEREQTGEKALEFKKDIVANVLANHPSAKIDPNAIQIFTSNLVDGKPQEARVVINMVLDGVELKITGEGNTANMLNSGDPIKAATKAALREIRPAYRKKLREQQQAGRKEAREGRQAGRKEAREGRQAERKEAREARKAAKKKPEDS
jgi:hypothetical protein